MEQNKKPPELFDPVGVTRGNRRLLATALILGAVTVTGYLLKRPAYAGGTDFGSILYAIGLAGLVGFGTNWLAIKMLFHPHKPFFGIQGVIPRKREVIAERVSRLMEEHLISGHRLHTWISDSGGLDAAARLLQQSLPKLIAGEQARSALADGVHGLLCSVVPDLTARMKTIVFDTIQQQAGSLAAMAMPMVEPIMDSATEKIQAHLTDRSNLTGVIDQAAARIESMLAEMVSGDRSFQTIRTLVAEGMESVLGDLKVSDLIRSELLKQDEAELEQLVNEAAADQLVFLQVAGGGLGALAGLALVWPWLLAVYVAPVAIGLTAKRLRAKS